MGGRVLSLDTVCNATFHFSRKWSEGVTGNQARDVLRFLLCKLWDQSRGRLVGGQVTLAQVTLARKLHLSRRWVGILVGRLERAGWIHHVSPVLENGMNGSSVFRIGPQLKRLLVMLGKVKKPTKSVAKSTWRFSPSTEEKKMLLIREKENEPLKLEVLLKIPLLQRWMERGRG